MHAHGATREQALQELHDAYALYVEHHEGPLPPPRLRPTHSGQTRLRLPPELHAELARAAERSGLSLNAYMVLLLNTQATVAETVRALAAVETTAACSTA